MRSLAGWTESKLRDKVISFIVPMRDKPPFWSGNTPWCRIEDITGKYLEASKSDQFVDDKTIKKMNLKVFPIGTVICSCSARLGVCAIVGQELVSNQTFIGLVPGEDLDAEFLYYKMTAKADLLQALSSGTTIAYLPREKFEEFEIEHPTSKLEQVKIAEILSTVDRAIEQTEASIAKQQRIKTGLMQDLLTRGIDEHGNPRSESTHKFKDSHLGRIPAEWNAADLESIATFVTSGSRGWAQYYSTQGAIFLRIGNLTRAHINLRFDDLVLVNPPLSSEGKRTAVRSGDLLISITADLGIIGMIPSDFGEAYVNQHIALIRLREDVVNPRFVAWFLSSRGGQSQFEALNESGAKAGLNLPTIKRLLLSLPSLTEQTRIATILDEATERANAHIRRGAKLRSLKTALVQDLLTGKKRVTPLLELALTN
jgi:type I restriction enzyme, S subunit